MDHRIGPFDSVTVFGGATIDRVAVTRGPAVPGASNPGSIRTSPGGVGLNVAVNLARLGHRVRLAARVGADPEGESIIRDVAAAGVDTAAIAVSPTRPSAIYQATLDNAGNLVIGVSDMGICDEMIPAVLTPAARASPAADLWVVDANLPAATLAFLVDEARAAGHPVVAIAVSPAKALRLMPLLGGLTLVFANRREAAVLLGLPAGEAPPSAADLAHALGGRRRQNAVVTDAGESLAVAANGEVRSFTPFPAAVRSVNGAGDALAAGIIHGLADGRPLFAAIPPGLAAAAITVEEEGTASQRLSRDALLKRIAGS